MKNKGGEVQLYRELRAENNDFSSPVGWGVSDKLLNHTPTRGNVTGLGTITPLGGDQCITPKQNLFKVILWADTIQGFHNYSRIETSERFAMTLILTVGLLQSRVT